VAYFITRTYSRESGVRSLNDKTILFLSSITFAPRTHRRGLGLRIAL
jgi:hypothetical protein